MKRTLPRRDARSDAAGLIACRRVGGLSGIRQSRQRVQEIDVVHVTVAVAKHVDQLGTMMGSVAGDLCDAFEDLKAKRWSTKVQFD